MKPFIANPARPYAVLLGTAATLKLLSEFAASLQSMAQAQALVLLEVSTADALKLRPSTVMIDGMPPPVIACVVELAALGIVSRLASEAELPGCFEGSVSELLAQWLGAQTGTTRSRITLYVAASATLCDAVQAIATRFQLDCQQLIH